MAMDEQQVRVNCNLRNAQIVHKYMHKSINNNKVNHHNMCKFAKSTIAMLAKGPWLFLAERSYSRFKDFAHIIAVRNWIPR
jgi:hypothetical protein